MRSHCNSDSEESSEYEECGLESSASDLKGWMARELYSPEVAAQILALPVLSCGVTDRLMWPHTTQIWYTQAYDKQHVDQSNCRRVPRRSGFSRLVLVSGRLEKKEVPWQLALLIEDLKNKEVG
ncbi:hypothetical protein SO802_024756 [Lithocarpus litseifolius]|uniref:Uncharacterized protein n=1 Tax=Lithocarpus litseifolius TaxID=425828 RepID=A0AAW2CBJ9_9ROSI